MEFFKQTNIDFLGKKWYFLTLTMILFVVGMASLAIEHGPKLGIDFTGGTMVDVKFSHPAPLGQVRSGLEKIGLGASTIQPVGGTGGTEVLISVPLSHLRQADLEKGRQDIEKALYSVLGQPQGKLDLNNISPQGLAVWLMQKDPSGYVAQGDPQAQAKYTQFAELVLRQYRDRRWDGLVPSFQALAAIPGMSASLLQQMQTAFFLGPFSIRSVNIVGPEVGAQLRGQAVKAVLLALLGMLIYIALRFEWIYGVAAVVAVFHDVLITLGMFSLFRIPIDLTVIAAFLTLVGYSMNDTIVVFDRVRENLRILRREKLADVVNKSINQTLSRTVLTSGLTFLSVLSLLVLGGEVLRGFSFAMTFGILVGTYSSIAVAAPMMVAYIDWRNRRQRPLRAVAAGRPESEVKPAGKRADRGK